MNLIFRFIGLVIALLTFKKKRITEPTHTYEYNTLVYPTDLDLQMHMNNGRYLSIMDIGRTELLVRSGLFKACKTNGWIPVVAGIKIKYRKQFFLFKKFCLKTRTVSWDEKWFFMEQQFERKGSVRCEALVRGCFIKRKTGKPVPTRELFKIMGYDFDKEKKLIEPEDLRGF